MLGVGMCIYAPSWFARRGVGVPQQQIAIIVMCCAAAHPEIELMTAVCLGCCSSLATTLAGRVFEMRWVEWNGPSWTWFKYAAGVAKRRRWERLFMRAMLRHDSPPKIAIRKPDHEYMQTHVDALVRVCITRASMHVIINTHVSRHCHTNIIRKSCCTTCPI